MRCFIASAPPLKLKYQAFTLPKYISRLGVRNVHKSKPESTTREGGDDSGGAHRKNGLKFLTIRGQKQKFLHPLPNFSRAAQLFKENHAFTVYTLSVTTACGLRFSMWVADKDGAYRGRLCGFPIPSLRNAHLHTTDKQTAFIP